MFTAKDDRNSSPQSVTSLKVVLLGDAGTGKSSLASRFVKNEFLPYSESTLGVSFLTKTFEIPINYNISNVNTQEESRTSGSKAKIPCRHVSLKIWDTAGQEKFSSLASMYYRGAAIAILVYDICNPVSFEALHRWITELKESPNSNWKSRKSSPDNNDSSDEGTKNNEKETILAVVGNKCDLNCDRRISRSVAEEYSRSIDAFYIETSARENIMVEHLFMSVAHRALEKGTVADTPNVETYGCSIRLGDGETDKAGTMCCGVT